MKVLILGASGFCGFPAAQALVRAGHYVIGQTRSQEKAKQLIAEEIIPIVAEVDKPDTWTHVVKDLDAVIECVGGFAEMERVSKEIFLAVRKAAQELRPQGAPKLTYIYTSGVWVHGDSRTEVFTDTTPVRSPVAIFTWRPEREQLIANDQILNGVVIRPAILYGRSASHLGSFFKSASQGHISYPGTPGGRISTLHTDDLADLYVRVTEKAAICGGLIFDATNDQTESVDDVLATLVKVSRAKAYEYKAPTNSYEEALAATTLVRPYLARSLLDWYPRKPGLVDGLPIYYDAWKAAQSSL